VFADILEKHQRKRDLTLGELQPPLSTAAFDVASGRLLVYSTRENRDMSVAELLGIATAIPLVYPPHERGGRQLLDASVASYAPVWLASGQDDRDLPIVVLRTHARKREEQRTSPPGALGLAAWINEVMSGAVASRDSFLLARMPRVNVFDIPVNVSALAFDLPRGKVEELIDAGRFAVADQLEREQEPVVAAPSEPDDDIAEGRGAELYENHLDSIASGRTRTIFISYAREDCEWVERLRRYLGELIADPHVTVWYDQYIKPSSLWASAIEDAIRRAVVGVLFISECFEKSDFIRRVERPGLEARVPGRRLCISIDGALPSGTEDGLELFGDGTGLECMGEAEADKALEAFGRLIEKTYRAAVAAG
jgi:hypothetical protein